MSEPSIVAYRNFSVNVNQYIPLHAFDAEDLKISHKICIFMAYGVSKHYIPAAAVYEAVKRFSNLYVKDGDSEPWDYRRATCSNEFAALRTSLNTVIRLCFPKAESSRAWMMDWLAADADRIGHGHRELNFDYLNDLPAAHYRGGNSEGVCWQGSISEVVFYFLMEAGFGRVNPDIARMAVVNFVTKHLSVTPLRATMTPDDIRVASAGNVSSFFRALCSTMNMSRTWINCMNAWGFVEAQFEQAEMPEGPPFTIIMPKLLNEPFDVKKALGIAALDASASETEAGRGGADTAKRVCVRPPRDPATTGGMFGAAFPMLGNGGSFRGDSSGFQARQTNPYGSGSSSAWAFGRSPSPARQVRGESPLDRIRAVGEILRASRSPAPQVRGPTPLDRIRAVGEILRASKSPMPQAGAKAAAPQPKAVAAPQPKAVSAPQPKTVAEAVTSDPKTGAEAAASKTKTGAKVVAPQPQAGANVTTTMTKKGAQNAAAPKANAVVTGTKRKNDKEPETSEEEEEDPLVLEGFDYAEFFTVTEKHSPDNDNYVGVEMMLIVLMVIKLTGKARFQMLDKFKPGKIKITCDYKIDVLQIVCMILYFEANTNAFFDGTASNVKKEAEKRRLDAETVKGLDVYINETVSLISDAVEKVTLNETYLKIAKERLAARNRSPSPEGG